MKGEDDRRIRKTRAALKQAFINLLSKKDIKEISVRELTEQADVNRGTFYLHYRDVYDFFTHIEGEVLAEFERFIQTYQNHPPLQLSLLLNLFQYIVENAQVFQAILKTGETKFLDRLIEICRPPDTAEFERLYENWTPEHYHYNYDFVAHGCVAMLRRWLKQGMPETPEYMAELAERMILSCVENFR
ncbi:MAG: TetR/AcrR family transcriptional regulator [Treponema sp.]|jgi:AcrR family transcriptional regulator|nr:TetR/AcrR family transcriptional regulator [Treponema sp.]